MVSQFFRHAQRKEILFRHLFEGVCTGYANNETRQVFVSREQIQAVIETCPNWQWRSVAALARYGGLRCSSEVALLKWTDIHWDKDRFTVTSPKTKRYGKPSRIVPIFPELRPFLEEALEMTEEGAEFVIPMLKGQTDKNLGTTFTKIISRAGIVPWVKPFQNLRLSRQTELEQDFPTYVVCNWLGNTPNVARKHYLKVTEDHFSSAASISGDKLGMQPPATNESKMQRITLKPGESVTFAAIVGHLEMPQIAEEGLEPPTRGL